MSFQVILSEFQEEDMAELSWFLGPWKDVFAPGLVLEAHVYEGNPEQRLYLIQREDERICAGWSEVWVCPCVECEVRSPGNRHIWPVNRLKNLFCPGSGIELKTERVLALQPGLRVDRRPWHGLRSLAYRLATRLRVWRTKGLCWLSFKDGD
jgi:hypothetical protein